MMTHYLDLRCLTPPNETGWMLGRVMRQVHGYLASGNISDLAVALPRMKSHHPGDCLRLFAAMDRLEDLLDKTGLRHLQESGAIDLADVSEVPKHTEFAIYTRARLPEKGSSSQIARREARFLEHLKKKGLTPDKALLKARRKRWSESFSSDRVFLSMGSQCTGQQFQLFIERKLVRAAVSAKFGHYGLSFGSKPATVPHF